MLEAATRVRDAARRSARGGPVAGVLDALTGVVPFDHASLARWDASAARHVMLADNYGSRVAAYLSAHLHEDPLFRGLRRSSATLWLRDVPAVMRRASATIRDVLEPAGFEDGMTKRLYAADGRYVGVLNLSLRRSHDAVRTADLVLGLLDGCLADAVDPWAPLPGDPDAADNSTWVLVPDSGAVPVDCAVPDGFAGRHAPLAEVVRRAARCRPLPATVLVPHGQRLWELRLRPQGTATLVSCRAVPPPARLSFREVEVLSQLTGGLTNPEIAARLYVGPRTVATHVEHILAKLDVPNRAAAAGRAAAWGLEPCL